MTPSASLEEQRAALEREFSEVESTERTGQGRSLLGVASSKRGRGRLRKSHGDDDALFEAT